MLTFCIVNKGGDETTEHKTENIQEKTIFNEDNCKILKLTYSKIKFAKWLWENMIYLNPKIL